MTTTNQPNTIIMGNHTMPLWMFNFVTTALFAGITAAGAVLIALQMPPSVMPEPAPRASVPLPHSHCVTNRTDDGRFIPQHRITIPLRDIDRLSLVLQDFAHRQGGCYSFVWPKSHLISLPEPALRQVLDLNRANYSQQAASLDTATSVPGDDGLHQIFLHITPARYQNLWVYAAGIAMAIIGGLCLLGYVLVWFLPESER